MTGSGLRHPPLQPGWIDRPHLRMALGDFPLEAGGVIAECAVSYVTHGTRSARDDNVVLCLSAIGSTHHRLDFLIGPGRALDPDRHFIICVDALGNGLSTSPSNSRTQPGITFPRFDIRDMVESQLRLLKALGIERLAAVVGASMGGMQALQWGVSHPGMAQRIVALVPMARTRSWSVAMNEAGRRALMGDPGWPTGDIGPGWAGWAAVMRMLTSREPKALESMPRESIHDVVTRLGEDARRHGAHAIDWVYQSWAYDAHDVGTTPGFAGTEAALRAIRAPTLLMVPVLDLYNPVEDAEEAAALIPGARLVRLPSATGHAAAAADTPDRDLIDDEIRKFLQADA
ncbi:MAG: alpha/beta fold hydrolase [Alphaproteobacteria bacterium]|nr:alpha/beta fold hydrolase [Alphaproteobacteria bacterium]